VSVPFKQIPSNIRVPLFYAEVDPTHANTAQLNQRSLLIGQKTNAGTAVANVPVLVASVAEAKQLCGQGSILAQMVDTYRLNDQFGELWLLPVADAGGAVAAVGSVKTDTAATAAGTLYLYIAGMRVTLGLSGAQTAAQIATALAAAVNAINDLPVTAAVDGVDTTKVNLTAKNLGLAGNDIDIRFNYRGAAGGESLPTGYAATITAMASGATNPTLTTALANLADEPFDFIAMPWTDATSLDALRDFLNDTTGRWSWQRQLYGHMITAHRATFANRVTLGIGRNDQHSSIMGFFDSPTPNWRWAAAVCAQTAVATRADAGRPLQTLSLAGILAPPIQSRDPLANRNTLLFDGISTFFVDAAGGVRIERLVTTYQKNAFGQPDNSYLDAETMFLIMYILRSLTGVVTTQFARVKLAADGTRFSPGLDIVTPSIIREHIIANYRELEFAGFVQNSEEFAAGLIVEQDASDPSRVNVLWAGILINGLRIFALLAQFRHS
jgi:phage tail sheath gpL-like